MTSISCPDGPRGEADVSMLELALRQNTDLVVALQDNRKVLKMIEQADVRLMTFSPVADRLKHCDRRYRLDSDAAVKELVAHFERREIKTIVQVGIAGAEEILDLRPHLKFTGIRLMSWNIPRCRTRTGVECITYGVQSDFVKRFGLGKGALPDLFFFRDDFAAVGGLSALLASGVRIPEDVRVVSLSNRGNCPVCPRSLARLEIDPVCAGIVCAEQTLATLCPSRFGVPENAAYRYIRGETFP